MGLESKAGGSESRFAVYVEAITRALGHADRAAPLQYYSAVLLLPGDRKSVEPMAARVSCCRNRGEKCEFVDLIPYGMRIFWPNLLSIAAMLANFIANVPAYPLDGGMKRVIE